MRYCYVYSEETKNYTMEAIFHEFVCNKYGVKAIVEIVETGYIVALDLLRIRFTNSHDIWDQLTDGIPIKSENHEEKIEAYEDFFDFPDRTIID